MELPAGAESMYDGAVDGSESHQAQVSFDLNATSLDPGLSANNPDNRAGAPFRA